LRRRFVAGETALEAIEAVKETQSSDGILATLDLLGENVCTAMLQADEAVEEYYRLFQLITDHQS
jgi:predicted phosphoribosyltransferase